MEDGGGRGRVSEEEGMYRRRGVGGGGRVLEQEGGRGVGGGGRDVGGGGRGVGGGGGRGVQSLTVQSTVGPLCFVFDGLHQVLRPLLCFCMGK